MDAIKKKMLAMKMDKENALDRAEQMEQKLRDTEEQKAKLEEDLNTLQKKYANLENEFDKANEGLIEANTKLETAEKRLNEDEDSEELDEPCGDPRALAPHPTGIDPTERAPATALPVAATGLCVPAASSTLAFSTPAPLAADIRSCSGSGDGGGGGGGGGTKGEGGGGGGGSTREPSEEPYTDCLGVDLSQDSQLSASTLSLSQELSLSQGSQDPGDATPTDGAKPKRKGSKKTKKKKVKSSSSKAKEGSPSQSTTARDSTQCSDTGTLERPDKERKVRTKSSKGEKSDKKSRTQTSSRRPEPEGGNIPIPPLSTLEYEKIINGNEPLFSDVDISAEDETSAPPPRPLRHSRLGRAAAASAAADGVEGIFIPCTQLGINSNTMIKFAIIGTELQNIFQVSHRVSEGMFRPFGTGYPPTTARSLNSNLASLASDPTVCTLLYSAPCIATLPVLPYLQVVLLSLYRGRASAHVDK